LDPRHLEEGRGELASKITRRKKFPLFPLGRGKGNNPNSNSQTEKREGKVEKRSCVTAFFTLKRGNRVYQNRFPKGTGKTSSPIIRSRWGEKKGHCGIIGRDIVSGTLTSLIRRWGGERKSGHSPIVKKKKRGVLNTKACGPPFTFRQGEMKRGGKKGSN